MATDSPLPEPQALRTVELTYPRLAGHVDSIEVALDDVRAARSIRIQYDFDRDGWVIGTQRDPGNPGPDAGCIDGDDRYFEVAFVRAWHAERSGMHHHLCTICRCRGDRSVAATHVASAANGLEWFECARHEPTDFVIDGEVFVRAKLIPIPEWFRAHQAALVEWPRNVEAEMRQRAAASLTDELASHSAAAEPEGSASTPVVNLPHDLVDPFPQDPWLAAEAPKIAKLTAVERRDLQWRERKSLVVIKAEAKALGIIDAQADWIGDLEREVRERGRMLGGRDIEIAKLRQRIAELEARAPK